MTETEIEIDPAPHVGNKIHMWIVADRRQLETTLRRLITGSSVEVTLGWSQSDWMPKPPRREAQPQVRRLPVYEREGRTRYLRVDEIDWIEAERQYVRLHMGGKSFLTRGPTLTIRDLASRLAAAHFLRVHRSHLVNLNRVEVLITDGSEKRYAVLTGGQEVPVSQTYWEQLQAALAEP